MMRHHTADGMFAHADIHDVWIAIGDRNRANGARLEITIRDISPAQSHVVRFPDTASSRAHVVGFGIAYNANTGDGTAATKRTDRAPFHCFENGVVVIGSALRRLRRALNYEHENK